MFPGPKPDYSTSSIRSGFSPRLRNCFITPMICSSLCPLFRHVDSPRLIPEVLNRLRYSSFNWSGFRVSGQQPSLSIELTREYRMLRVRWCPPWRPGDSSRIGGSGRSLSTAFWNCVDRLKPLHLSLVGGRSAGPLPRVRGSVAATDRPQDSCADRHQCLLYVAGNLGVHGSSEHPGFD